MQVFIFILFGSWGGQLRSIIKLMDVTKMLFQHKY